MKEMSVLDLENKLFEHEVHLSSEKVFRSNPLEFKALAILRCMDLDVTKVFFNGKTFYVLYENMEGSFKRQYDSVAFIQLETESEEELEHHIFENFYASYNIASLLEMLDHDYFDQYNFDWDKCFDDSVLDFRDCRNFRNCHFSEDEEDVSNNATKQYIACFSNSEHAESSILVFPTQEDLKQAVLDCAQSLRDDFIQKYGEEYLESQPQVEEAFADAMSKLQDSYSYVELFYDSWRNVEHGVSIKVLKNA